MWHGGCDGVTYGFFGGGYVAANSHSTIASVRPENIHAMCKAAREFTFNDREF